MMMLQAFQVDEADSDNQGTVRDVELSLPANVR
jgi:hypothetical protein